MTKRILFQVGDSPLSAAEVIEGMFDDLIVIKDEKDLRLTRITAQDVVVFDGGTDISPSLYNEAKNPFTDNPNVKRDQFERNAFIRAQSVGAGCFGVCRGAQLLCVLSGGKLIQHVTNHYGQHSIITKNKEMIMADSSHHQMMWPNNINHDLIAHAIHFAESHCEYGKDFHELCQPEIIWLPYTRSLCVQGHPEYVEIGNRFRAYCIELVQSYLLNERT